MANSHQFHARLYGFLEKSKLCTNCFCIYIRATITNSLMTTVRSTKLLKMFSVMITKLDSKTIQLNNLGSSMHVSINSHQRQASRDSSCTLRANDVQVNAVLGD